MIQNILVIYPVPYGMLVARLELELRSLSPESGVLSIKRLLFFFFFITKLLHLNPIS